MTSKRMNKSQFVVMLAEKSGLDKKQATSALNTINAIVAQNPGGNKCASIDSTLFSFIKVYYTTQS